MSADSPVSVLLVTAPSAEVAERIVVLTVEERLAACGSIVPGLTSIYRWLDEVQREAEVLIVFKTTPARRAALMERIRQLHPYEVPEILSLPVDAGLAAYVEWVQACTNG